MTILKSNNEVPNRCFSILNIAIYSSLIAFAMASPARAADLPQAPIAASVQPSDDDSYLLMPLDTISVVVVGFPELSTQSVVTPDGTIAVPLLKTVKVAGKSLATVRDTIEVGMSKYLVKPTVAVSLYQKHRQSVSVFGAVQRPGAVEFKPGMRALEAVAQAGGLMPTADATLVSLTRKAGPKVTLDLDHPELKAGSDVDAVLSEDDSIYIPDMKSQVSVVGQVKVPGSLMYKDSMTVLDALGAAGGVNMDEGDLKKSKIIHNGVDTPLDLDAMLRKGDMSANMKLAPGDRIFVPDAVRTQVIGNVQRPGYYTYKDGDRVMDAINGCGGTAPGADLKGVRLVRIAKDKNSAVSYQVNLENYLKKGTIADNAVLQPGDVVYVSTKQAKDSSTSLWGILNGMNILNAGARILSHGLGN